MPNPTLVPITQPRVPFLNPETGFVSMPWYRFLLSLSQLTGGSEVSLGDLQKGPPTLTVDEINAIIDKTANGVTPLQDGLLAQIAELQKQVQAQDLYECCNVLISQFTELQKQVDGLQMQPPVQEIAGVTISPPATNNIGLAINTPIISARSFAVPSDAQVLFAEPIHMNEGTWLEVFTGAVLREVR